jgi:thiol-disulfide isomerase/thioredoxin
MKKILSLLLLFLLSTMPTAFAKTPGEVEIGSVVRDSSMQGLTGGEKKLSEFRGKPLIINVWASWCGPCRMEMGSLERLNRRYGGKQFQMIGISTDDYPERAQAFLQQAKTSFPHFIDRKLVLENMLGADRLPLTVLVDADGKVLAKYYGAKEWDSPQAIEVISKAFGIKL